MSSVQRDYHLEQATFQIGIGNQSSHKHFTDCSKCGTGFYLSRNGNTHLVTNWHNVTGKNPETGKIAGGDDYKPLHLIVRDWVNNKEHRIELYDKDGNPLWNEIPEPIDFERGTKHHVDVVTIPFQMETGPIIFESVYKPAIQKLEPAQEVLVLGYPYHRERCIWKTAHIAESVQPTRPYFLINGRTKSGMSGSGVYSAGYSVIAEVQLMRQTASALVGVYSGRINDVPRNSIRETLDDLDIGIVWKLDVIDRLIPPLLK